ncbi:hypothetical protein FRB90_012500 [Tulasnella sp. 427]|nr:hypothetical protein FRB90_012500 [Tulasnella sp. 427]
MKIQLSLSLAALLASLQANAQTPRPAPEPRPFHMHDMNFIHTSDIHSWYLGHRGDKTKWDANIGDVVTFVDQLRKTGASRKQDVIFVDTGDQTHGGGLSDADKPEGAQALLLHTSLPYDALSPGNHELEREPVARNLAAMLEAHPLIKAKYLAANVFYQPPNDPKAAPRLLGSTHRTWTTDFGKKKVTAVGVMFQNSSKTKSAGVTIKDPDTILDEDWFKQGVLDSKSDVFVLLGHMSLYDSKTREQWRKIHGAIRNKNPEAAILIFAGHTHQRECVMGLNGENPIRSLGMESGRYLETVGWVGANFTSDPQHPLALSRLHIEPRREQLVKLTGAVDTVFAHSSESVMKPFNDLAERFGLHTYFGCLKNSYPWDDKAFDPKDPHHSLNLWRNVAFPDIVPPPNSGPYALLLNNGFIRGPLYSGNFTLNDKFVNTPYDSQPFYKTRIPKWMADLVWAKIPRRELQLVDTVLSGGDQRPMIQGRYMRGVALKQREELTEQNCDSLGYSPPLTQIMPPPYINTTSKGYDDLNECQDVDFVTLEFLKGRAGDAIKALKAEPQYERCRSSVPDKPVWEQYGTAYSGDVIKDWITKHTVEKNGVITCADHLI